MMDVAIAVLGAYLILSAAVALGSTLLHLFPVMYSLSTSAPGCFCVRNKISFTLAYFTLTFIGAPRIFMTFTDSDVYKLALYRFLKDQ